MEELGDLISVLAVKLLPTPDKIKSDYRVSP